jgi:hypothetical protein
MPEHHTIKASMLLEKASDLEAEACFVEEKERLDVAGWTRDAEVGPHDGVLCCVAAGIERHFEVSECTAT